MKKLTTGLSLIAILTIGIEANNIEERVKNLEEKNNVLKEELLAVQSDGFTSVDITQSHSGLGAAASKVYYSKTPLSIGGYGEMFYANPDNGDDFSDVYRFVNYFGYKFTDNIILNAEIEFEHGGAKPKSKDTSGYVVMEFLYLDFLFNNALNLRVGNLLVPFGNVGLRHEPTLFNTVQRPEVEKLLIPTTWGENGVLAYGRSDDLGIEYQAGVINALNINSEKTKDGNIKWIRSARQGVANKASWDPAFVGRLDYVGINGLKTGVSVYTASGSNLKNPKADATIQDVSGLTTNMFDIHAQYDNGAFSAYGLYTQTTLDGAEKISSSAVEKGSGYYANLAYDVSDIIGIKYKTPLFIQYQNYNPVEQTVDGSNQDTYQTEVTTVGLNFFPTEQVVLKADYAMKSVNNIENNTFSLAFGFIF